MAANKEAPDKKKSGMRNAANKPLRLNGLPLDHAARSAGAYNVGARHIGAHMARAAIGAILVQRLGRCQDFTPSPRLDKLMSDSLDRCPVAGAVFEGIGAS
ncbi:MAG: hypothetical protein Q7R71_01635 [bacterium]|nr:hypothetical protein [bacterium]